MTTHRLGIEQARQVAIKAQALTGDRATNLVGIGDWRAPGLGNRYLML